MYSCEDLWLSLLQSGSRALSVTNIARFFLPEVLELDLSTFWLTDEPFINFPCTDLVLMQI